MRVKKPGVACGIVAAVLTSGASTGGALTYSTSAHAEPASTIADDVIAAKVRAQDVRSVGLVLSNPEPIKLRALSGAQPESGTTGARPTNPVNDNGPVLTANALGIPEIVLAAYRNAELAMANTTPGCGIPWHLLAGIGKIESGHASGGNTNGDGTTITPILGPSLDGTLPGNEIIMSADNTFVRAVGPMQFLPSTWTHYAADGNGDGATDPNNVFDAALGAAQYLCSGGLDLRDPAAELRAVLRYNNSTAYASDVLSWSATYGSGGSQSGAVSIPVEIAGPDPVPTEAPEVAPEPVETPAPATEPAPAQVAPEPPMITIPGLPPIPCGIFCPPTPS